MNFDVVYISVFLLVLARTTSWAVTAPVLSMPGISPIARLAMAVSLAVFLTPLFKTNAVPHNLPDFVAAAAGQVVIGLLLGFLTNLLITAIQILGSLTDLVSGFSTGAIFDPTNGAQSSAFSRLTSMTFAALFFATGAYTSVIAGFSQSFAALPLSSWPHFRSDAAGVLATAVVRSMVAAIEIGAPLLGLMFLTDVTIAIASRFVPQANALSISLPAKALIALAAAGGMLAVLPGHVDGLVSDALNLPAAVLQ